MNPDNSVAIDNLFLINKSVIIRSDEINIDDVNYYTNNIKHILRVPNFYYNTEGSILIIFILQDLHDNVNLLIIQQVNDRYIVLYPEEINFDFHYRVKNVIYYNVVEKIHGEEISTSTTRLKRKNEEDIDIDEGIEPSSKRIKMNYLSDISFEKQRQIFQLVEEYSKIAIDNIFMNTLLENHIVLPNDNSLVERILDLLTYPDYKILSIISYEYQGKVTEYLYDKFYKRFPFLNKVSNIKPIDLMYLIGYLLLNDKKFKDNEYHIVDWAAEYGYINILHILNDGFIGPDNITIRLVPTQNGIYSAIRKNQNDVIDFMFYLRSKLHPSQQKILSLNSYAADRAADYGNINLLNRFEQIGVLPSFDAANRAAVGGHVDVLEWLAPLKVTSLEELENDPNITLSISDIDVEKRWYLENDIKVPLIPHQHELSNITSEGKLDVLIWLKRRGILSDIGKEKEIDALNAQEIDEHGLEVPVENVNVSFKIYILRSTANDAAGANNTDILDWMEQNISIFDINNNFVPMLPNQKGVNEAAQYGQILALDWLENRNIIPNHKGAILAAEEDSLNTLIWMEERGYLNFDPDAISNIVDEAAEFKAMSILNWFKSKNIYPTKEGISKALLHVSDFQMNNFMKVMLEFKKQDIYPTLDMIVLSIGHAVQKNFYKFLSWIITDEARYVLYPKGEGPLILKADGIHQYILPNQRDIDSAAKFDNLDILILLASQKIITDNGLPFKLLPSVDGANEALENNHIDVVNWLEKQGVVPTKINLDHAIVNGHISTLEYAEKKNIKFTAYTANFAAIQGKLNILMWLEKRGILPDARGLQAAYDRNHVNVILSYSERKELFKRYFRK